MGSVRNSGGGLEGGQRSGFFKKNKPFEKYLNMLMASVATLERTDWMSASHSYFVLGDKLSSFHS